MLLPELPFTSPSNAWRSVMSKVTPARAALDGCAATTLAGPPMSAAPVSSGGSLVCAEAVAAISHSNAGETLMILVMPGCGAGARARLVRSDGTLVGSCLAEEPQDL